MKFLVKAAVIAAALGASAAASATTFDFSYSFTDGLHQQITGSLEGTLNGTTISDISDIQLALNGTAFSGGAGPLQLVAWNSTTGAYDDAAAATISTIGSQNNFGIADVDMADLSQAAAYYFTLVNDPLHGPFAVGSNFLVSDGSGSTALAVDDATGTWKVTPVPLPAAFPLLLSGLGLFGFGRRRLAK
ncbi:MAG TPA: PEP-CTERM sorting domain-containing protein [Steroidobacteraceae bacterium]|jgi:hypothetical protein